MWAGVVDRRLFGLALEGSAALFLDELRQELYAGLRRKYQVGAPALQPDLHGPPRHRGRAPVRGRRRRAATAGDPRGDRIPGVERGLPNGWELAARACSATPGRARPRALHAGPGGPSDPGEPHSRASGAGRGRLDRRLSARAGSKARSSARSARAVHAPAPARLGRRPPASGRLPARRRRRLPRAPHRRASGRPRGDARAHVHRTAQGAAAGPGRVGRRPHRLRRGVCWATTVGSAECGPGVGADTPVGPVRFEYGYSTEDRGAVLVSLGDWF